MRDALAVYGDWILDGRGGEEPPLVKAALRHLNRLDKAAAATVDPTVDMDPIKAYADLRARSGAFAARAAVRVALADYIDEKVLPGRFVWDLLDVSKKLRYARPSYTWGCRPGGKPVMIWDNKSGLVRLDPDEAHQEAQRVSARYKPHLVNLAEQGYRLYYAVLTMPHFASGQLRHGKDFIYNQFKNFLRKRHLGKLLFPEIKGALVVQEDPLSAAGEWNVHLNVILVTDGYFDFGKARRAWGYNCHFRKLRGNADALGATFAELIKYACRVVPEKSADKAAAGSRAPAMTEWPPERFIEWWRAQKGFKRTRTYGCLYGSKVPHPEAEDLSDVTWLGTGTLSPAGFVIKLPPINLIPGDNFASGSDYFDSTGPPFH